MLLTEAFPFDCSIYAVEYLGKNTVVTMHMGSSLLVHGVP